MASETDDRRPRRALVAPAWVAGNLVIGYFMILPLGTADTLAYYLRAVHGDDVVAPYGSDGATFAVVEILVLAGSLLTISVFFNRRHWRRFLAAQERPLPRKAAFLTALVLGAATLYGLPFLLFMMATNRTAPPLFPGSWS
ncbi:hypothetical protein ACQP2Y_14730 [Actinoplanes sp. CA-051413]|uniref:hypothetical protein n=1 Tax=Actinoplanes sp. CA-051413 TaxID=3239899 RepID=UPI003D96C000